MWCVTHFGAELAMNCVFSALATNCVSFLSGNALAAGNSRQRDLVCRRINA
jgi:hypothetical protein